MNREKSVLLHPSFYICLVVLLINDHVLKHHFPGFLTGKLSDFAGLYIFPLFWVGLFHGYFQNKRRIAALYFGVAIAFILWKSPVFDPLLILQRHFLPPFYITRVKDYGDLIALAVLPVSYLTGSYPRDQIGRSPDFLRRFTRYILIAVSIVAFTATSGSVPTRQDHQAITVSPMKRIESLYFLGKALSDNGSVCVPQNIEY